MKKIIQNALAAIAIAISIFAVSPLVEAYSCRTVPGHYVHGVWRPAHRVCSGYYHHCYWVNGHRWHGRWYPAHKVCR